MDDLESRIHGLTKYQVEQVLIIQQLHDRIAELTNHLTTANAALAIYRESVQEKQCAGWVNVYAGGCILHSATREGADCGPLEGRIACVPVMFTPGEGIGGGK